MRMKRLALSLNTQLALSSWFPFSKAKGRTDGDATLVVSGNLDCISQICFSSVAHTHTYTFTECMNVCVFQYTYIDVFATVIFFSSFSFSFSLFSSFALSIEVTEGKGGHLAHHMACWQLMINAGYALHQPLHWTNFNGSRWPDQSICMCVCVYIEIEIKIYTLDTYYYCIYSCPINICRMEMIVSLHKMGNGVTAWWWTHIFTNVVMFDVIRIVMLISHEHLISGI